MANLQTTDNRAPSLDATSFRAVLEVLHPGSDELRWRDIPWQTDLREACRLAAEEQKPIFLWAMNGNPLGCT